MSQDDNASSTCGKLSRMCNQPGVYRCHSPEKRKPSPTRGHTCANLSGRSYDEAIRRGHSFRTDVTNK